MGFKEKKRVRIKSFTSSQALERKSKLLDLGNALFSHLSSILYLKMYLEFFSFNALVSPSRPSEPTLAQARPLSLKRANPRLDENPQQQYESQTQTTTHPHAYTQTPAPQEQHHQQQQQFQYDGFGGMGDYSILHQFASSLQFQGTLPSIFGTTTTTPLSTYNSQQYYQPTMPAQGNFLDDEDDEDDDEEDEEEPQLVRGGRGQPRQRQQQQQQQLRVQPRRTRKAPACGTSSHRRH
ncbi:hypothetical protein Lal_00024274 [Lupinus albus]|nr:hypothetical protein Lal_00024274 [Lupinus albus]